MIGANSHEPLAGSRAAFNPRGATYHLAAILQRSRSMGQADLVMMRVPQDGLTGTRQWYPPCHSMPGGPPHASEAARRPDSVAASSADDSLQDAARWRWRAAAHELVAVRKCSPRGRRRARGAPCEPPTQALCGGAVAEAASVAGDASRERLLWCRERCVNYVRAVTMFEIQVSHSAHG